MVTVTQLALKYTKSTIFRGEALILNSVYTWTSQINADLTRKYTRQWDCQKQLKSNLFLMLEIRKQWLNLMHGKKCRDSYWQLQKRDILKFHEFTVRYLKSRYTETYKFRKKTLISSLTYRGKQGKGVA